MNSESPFWANFGKVSAVVTTFGALVGIWVVLTQTSEDLELYVEFHPYSVSPDIKTAANNNFNTFSYSELRDLLKEGVPKDLNEHEFSIRNFIEELHKKSWGGIDKYSFGKYGGLNFLSLTNSGDKTATDIEINFPEKGQVLIAYPDDTESIQEFNRVIKVNDLRAKNEISLVIWSESKLSKYDYEEINLTHKNGIGEVAWPIKATGLSWYFAEYPFFTPFIFYIIFMIGVFWGSPSKKIESENSKDEDT